MNPITETYKTQVKDSVHNWGTDITVFYYTTSQANIPWDPINDEPLNAATSDATSDNWIRTEQELVFKAVVNTFINDKSRLDRSLESFALIPESDIRLTFWLEDVLINHHSATGLTYIDNCDKVKVFEKFYKPKDRHRTGIESRPYVYIINGDEIKG